MAKSPSINYTREKSRYGGFTGSIQIHSVPGIITNNDPTSVIFRENLPAGYLRCDGSVKNVKDYYALAQVLGIGEECRFKKENTNLRNPDPDLNDLGNFQLPDLGSKVIVASQGPGEYRNITVENRPNLNRVGVLVDANSNVGTTINVNYIGDMTVAPSGAISPTGNAKFVINPRTSATALAIENFQAHMHDVTNKMVLNYSTAHADGVGLPGGGGKSSEPTEANSGAGNVLEEVTANVDRGAPHTHAITRPNVYSPATPFTYSHPEFNVSMENVRSFINVRENPIEFLNQVVTPFVLVEYIIKF
jgi:hypothetical protein